MGAPNARVVAVVQGIVRHVIFEDVAPHLLSRPIGERADFNQIKFLVPIDLANRGARGSLVATNCGHPSIKRSQLSTQWLDFPQIAALIGIACPERLPVSTLLITRREIGIKPFD